MKIKNNGLPDSIYNWMCHESYSKGDADISVTELINPPRARILDKLHYDEIEINADSLLEIKIGTAFHKEAERFTRSGIAERRLSCDVLGWKISGGMDHYEGGVLTDYKTGSVWKAVYSKSGRIEEYEKQLNIYAHILRANSIPINELKIFIWFKDFNKKDFEKFSKDKKLFVPGTAAGYPEKKWLYFNIKLWDSGVAEKFLYSCVTKHQKADQQLPLCTVEETWGGRRCKDYCRVSRFCTQYQQAQKTGLLEPQEATL